MDSRWLSNAYLVADPGNAHLDHVEHQQELGLPVVREALRSSAALD